MIRIGDLKKARKKDIGFLFVFIFCFCILKNNKLKMTPVVGV